MHDYDTVERDLELLGTTLSRLPLEAGVTWRLRLPRGETVEAWEPGNGGLAPPAEVMGLIEGVIAGRELVPRPPLSSDPGAIRLRETVTPSASCSPTTRARVSATIPRACTSTGSRLVDRERHRRERIAKRLPRALKRLRESGAALR